MVSQFLDEFFELLAPLIDSGYLAFLFSMPLFVLVIRCVFNFADGSFISFSSGKNYHSEESVCENCPYGLKKRDSKFCMLYCQMFDSDLDLDLEVNEYEGD